MLPAPHRVWIERCRGAASCTGYVSLLSEGAGVQKDMARESQAGCLGPSGPSVSDDDIVVFK